MSTDTVGRLVALKCRQTGLASLELQYQAVSSAGAGEFMRLLSDPWHGYTIRLSGLAAPWLAPDGRPFRAWRVHTQFPPGRRTQVAAGVHSLCALLVAPRVSL